MTKFVLSYVWKYKQGKVFILLKVIMSLFNAAIPLIYTFFPGLILNELVGDQQIIRIVIYASVLIAAPLLARVVNFYITKLLTRIKMYLELMFEETFFNHVANMDYETLENPNIQVMKDRAQQTLNGILGVVNQLSGLLLAMFSLLALISIVFTLNPFLVLLMILLAFFNSIIAKKSNQKQFLLGQELSKFGMFQGAYVYQLERFEYAKEMRLYQIKKLLIGQYIDSKKASNKLELKHYNSRNMPGITKSATDFVQQIILYAYLIYNVIKKQLPVGDMTIYLNAAGQFSSALNNVVDSYLVLANNSLNTQEFIDFINIPQNQYNTGKRIPRFDSTSIIEFRHVSFIYPGSERYALKDINLSIKGNEKLCIVGVNGSGKTTFIKLLTRLYFPTKGEILLNGVNINEYDYEKYQQLFAAVFQEFCTYSMTFKENIVLTKEYDKAKFDSIADSCGLSKLFRTLSKGQDTMANKWLDETGVDPSGGEEQRIAIARACYHGGEIFILDEPTAALDPMAEYEIYTQFNKMITDKCAVLITHRLSAVQLADKVAVFDNGHVAEYGTHQELYAKGGIYTEMFDKQAKFYRDEPQETNSEAAE